MGPWYASWEGWDRLVEVWAQVAFSSAVHHYKGQGGTKEMTFSKGDEFKLFAEAQGWYKAYKLPLENKEQGM